MEFSDLQSYIFTSVVLFSNDFKAYFFNRTTGQFPVGRLEILSMFDMESRPTIVKSALESADSGIESAHSTADSAVNRPVGTGLTLIQRVPINCLKQSVWVQKHQISISCS